MNLLNRIGARTPKIFRTIRTIGLILAAAGGTLLAGPAEIPEVLETVAGYLTLAGGVATAVSQVAVEGDPDG